MPLTPRSLGGLLLPALLSLSPLAASAASDVTILRDQWGIPQVYADDTYGLFAGFGYAVAEDRLFQMEMARRSVLGTVSEVLGPDHVEYDTKTRANFDQAKIRAQIRNEYSPRHVPDRIFQVHSIPYTLTGKKMEVPVRRILMGVPVEKAANRAAMANVESLDFFIDYAKTQSDYRLTT